jgi:hypothetical protein
MKKSKFLLISLVLLVLLGVSFFSVSVEVKADDDMTDYWGAPILGKVYVDFDNKGIRLYIDRLYGDDVTGELEYAIMRTVNSYQIGGIVVPVHEPYMFGRNYFHTDLLNGKIKELLQYWGEDYVIPETDRVWVYFDVNLQKFVLEWVGSSYWVYWMYRSSELLNDNESYNIGYNDGYDVGYGEGYSEGYDVGNIEGYDVGRTVGYDEGYNEGCSVGYANGYINGYDIGYNDGMLVSEAEAYERGFSDGQKSKLAENNEKFYNGLEKWLVPAIIAVILLGGFVSIAVRKRKEE